MAWQDRVKDAIAEQCRDAYKRANNGRKRHVAYSVPELAKAMVDALNRDDETEGKRLLLLWRTGALSLI